MNPSKFEPDVLHYSNYRTYLRDVYEFRKSKQPAFSHRYFAQKAGITSPNYLKLVMDGKRNLTKKSLVKFQSALGLKGKKAEFLENLVFFNQASTVSERNIYYEKILKVRARAGLRKLDESQYQLFSDWRHLVIRELAALKGFRPDPRWIIRKLGKGITEKQVEESLALLSEMGLLKRTANGVTQSDINITTSDEVRSLLVKNYHRQMLQKASSVLDVLPASQRDISTITIPIHLHDFSKVKEQIQLMRKEILNLAADPGEGGQVVQVNIQFFPLTGMQD
ncbi:MAG: TIGR02147 family protein [Fibrobacterota bacterium]|nr:TIGR02147 family protein [Fibrobacterota bacterium]